MKLSLNLTILLVCIWATGVAQNYTFNVKATFRIETKEGSATSYFYLNTRNGDVGQDTPAFRQMNMEGAEAIIFQYIQYRNRSMMQYAQVEGKRYVIEMPLSKENYTSKEFWKDFKKTGKRQNFGKYVAQEYVGMQDGRRLSIWLGDKVQNLDGRLQGDILGHYGVGYLYKPDEKAYYLLVHFKDEEGQVTLLDITPFPKSVALNGYEKMPAMPTTTLPGSTPKDYEEPQTPTNPAYPSQIYGMQDYKCSTAYELALQSIEMSLPSLKEVVKNNQVPAEQREELRKQIICMEKKVSILRSILVEAKRIDSQFAGNTEKMMEACQKISDKYNKQIESICP